MQRTASREASPRSRFRNMRHRIRCQYGGKASPRQRIHTSMVTSANSHYGRSFQGNGAEMADATTTRRLAAIVSADVVGYSRLMGVDEEATLASFNAHRRELIDPAIEQHRGRIVKTTGDGLLLEFASVVARCNAACWCNRECRSETSPCPALNASAFAWGSTWATSFPRATTYSGTA